MKKEDKHKVTITPFEGCNLKSEIDNPKIKKEIEKEWEKRNKPFPHNMQLDNMEVLQEENYHLFVGDYLKPAIYIKDAKFIKYDHLFYDIPFFKMGEKMIIIGYKIMLCNPHFTKEQLIDCLYHIFVEFCQIPQTKKLVEHVKKLGSNESFTEGNKKFTEENRKRIELAAEQIISNPFKGKIKKQPKVIFNPDYELTTDEKRELANELLGNKKSSDRIEEIYTTFITWDAEEKPTQKNIAKKLGISLRTVKTYWKQLKEKDKECAAI